MILVNKKNIHIHVFCRPNHFSWNSTTTIMILEWPRKFHKRLTLSHDLRTTHPLSQGSKQRRRRRLLITERDFSQSLSITTKIYCQSIISMTQRLTVFFFLEYQCLNILFVIYNSM